MFIYPPHDHADCYEIYRDGQRIFDWIFADDERGIVDIFELDWYSLERGERVRIPEENLHGYRFMTLKGSVQIKQVKPLPEKASDPATSSSCPLNPFDPYYGYGNPCIPFAMPWDGKQVETVVKRFLTEARQFREAKKPCNG